MHIRFIQPEEAEACNDFHNRVFGDNRTLDQWRWGFLPAGFAADRIPFVVVDDDGRIAGTQAFIPIRMIDRQGVFWTAKSEETLVDPAYRGKKLFEKMYALLMDYMRDHDLHCIWGFTAATKAFTRLGFETPGGTTQLFMPFSGRAVAGAIAGQQTAIPSGAVQRLKNAGYRVGSSLAGVYSSFKMAAGRRRTESRSLGLELKLEDAPPADAGRLTGQFIARWGGTTI